MSGSPIWIEAHASALEAHDRMVEFGIRHLPVLDEERHVVGVPSIDDLRAALPMPLSMKAPCPPEELESAREWQVGDVMTYAPHTIREDARLGDAADCMADHRIGCLPVVDGEGRLLAMLSETDLLRALATRSWTEEKAAQRALDAGRDLVVEDLRQERARITVRLDDLHSEDLAQAVESAEQTMAGADLRQASLAQRLEKLAARRLEAIDRALDHAAQGRLSVCDECGGNIPATRLRAVPGTTVCVSCARDRATGRPPHD
jgi:CBS domain-containing protein/RNA polymerase-binding transcription factor DksA